MKHSVGRGSLLPQWDWSRIICSGLFCLVVFWAVYAFSAWQSRQFDSSFKAALSHKGQVNSLLAEEISR